jgi:hypothetical protein
MSTTHRSGARMCEGCGERPAVAVDHGDAECDECTAKYAHAEREIGRLAERVRAAIAAARKAGLDDECIAWGIADARGETS